MRSICLPVDLELPDLDRLDAIVGTRRSVRRGDALYRADDAFQSLYAVRSGSFKTVVVHRDGGEQVTGLFLPGDPLGLDGVCHDAHACDAVALEDSSVCVIPFALFDAFCHDVKPMQRHFYRMMGSAIVRESNLLMVLGTMTAEQRVAAFLLNLSERFRTRGYSPTAFSLRMTREEMGSYLGIKLETVSRMFSKFQKDGLLETQGKSIHLLDLEGLARI
ncbi:Crp/Fnr family transcriptional regulator [Pararobbsia silviterrae]|uniref:Crp/Fnr family transcriptional regulator n=2 Tax=Pararobbsia silviterrae TaxID=1792498 RepID=A0A494Y1U6_9BURK|nr:Crp/Fnr family transcriptional regulator [Pararobbsia silviterrae]